MKTNYIVYVLTLAALLQSPLPSYANENKASSSAVSAEKISKEDFVQDMGQEVLGVLKDQKKTFTEKKAVLRTLFTETVDTNWIARFVLGPTWKTATPEQKSRYTELYRTYLTETYISKFENDSDSKVTDIKILNIKDAPANAFTAHTSIIQSDGETVAVDYLLKEKDGTFKVIDIIIEGVSLLATHRNEFNTLAASGGMEGVIKKLQELTSQQK